MYESPVLGLDSTTSLEEAEAWWVVPLAVVAAFGGAWAWCKSVCGKRGVKACETEYWKLRVKATCR
jgi:hypothetical protein